VIRVIPFAIVGIAFLLHKLGEELEDVGKTAFFFLALFCVPMSFYACSQVAIASSNSALETLCNWGYMLTAPFWLLLFIKELWVILNSYLQVGQHGK